MRDKACSYRLEFAEVDTKKDRKAPQIMSRPNSSSGEAVLKARQGCKAYAVAAPCKLTVLHHSIATAVPKPKRSGDLYLQYCYFTTKKSDDYLSFQWHLDDDAHSAQTDIRLARRVHSEKYPRYCRFQVSLSSSASRRACARAKMPLSSTI